MKKLKTPPAYPTLRRLREQAGLSQSELAELASVNKAHYNGIEHGPRSGKKRSPSIAIAWRIARALGRRIDEVFPYDEVVSVGAANSEPAEERTILDIYASE